MNLSLLGDMDTHMSPDGPCVERRGQCWKRYGSREIPYRIRRSNHRMTVPGTSREELPRDRWARPDRSC